MLLVIQEVPIQHPNKSTNYYKIIKELYFHLPMLPSFINWIDSLVWINFFLLMLCRNIFNVGYGHSMAKTNNKTEKKNDCSTDFKKHIFLLTDLLLSSAHMFLCCSFISSTLTECFGREHEFWWDSLGDIPKVFKKFRYQTQDLHCYVLQGFNFHLSTDSGVFVYLFDTYDFMMCVCNA